MVVLDSIHHAASGHSLWEESYYILYTRLIILIVASGASFFITEEPLLWKAERDTYINERWENGRLLRTTIYYQRTCTVCLSSSS